MDDEVAINDDSMVNRKTWEEFRETKLLWWINRILHTFGWAIIMEVDQEGNQLDVYPARVKFRGFSETIETDGFIGLSTYLVENAEQLEKEAKE